MSYLAYVAAAYAVFAVVMAWDFLAPRRSIRHQLRALRQMLAGLLNVHAFEDFHDSLVKTTQLLPSVTR